MASIVRKKTASGVIRYRAKVKLCGFKDVSKTFRDVHNLLEDFKL